MAKNQKITISEFKKLYESVKDKVGFRKQELNAIESAIKNKNMVFLEKIYKLMVVMVENENHIYEACDKRKEETVDEFGIVSGKITHDFIIKPKK